MIDTDGNTINLFTLTASGAHVAVNFVFDACPPCEGTAPYVQQSYVNYGCNGEEVQFITLVEGDATQALSVKDDLGFAFPVASGAAVTSAYGVEAFPTLVLISPSNVMLSNDIWPITSTADIDAVFALNGLSQNPCVASGCTDPLATNYDSLAQVDDGSCLYPTDLSEFDLIDIYGTPIYLQDIVDGGQHILFHFMGDWNVFDEGLTPEINDVYTQYGCNDHDVFVIAMNYSENGDVSSLQFVEDYGYLPPMVSIDGGSEAVRLAYDVDALPTIFLINPNGEQIGSDLYAAIDNTFTNIAFNFSLNGIETNVCTSLGCIDTMACNFDSTADTDDGSCYYSCAGCMDPAAINYNSTAIIDDGSCQYVDCANLGQINWSEFNTGLYAPNSEMQLGMAESTDLALSMTDLYFELSTNTTYSVSNFEMQSVSGLPNGIDYYVDGILNGTSALVSGEQACIQLVGTPLEAGDFPVTVTGTVTVLIFNIWLELPALMVHQLTVLPLDGDLFSCTYAAAENYNPIANVDDGSCEYAGCTSFFSVNYNPIASIDDGSCIEADGLCGAGSYWDFELQMCIVPPVCVADLNLDGEVSAVDLLTLLSVYGTDCE